VIVPGAAFHVTDLSEAVPCTAAVNCRVPLVGDDPEVGEMVTEVTVGPELFDPVATVTGAEADFVGSAMLVAVTTPVPALDDAVYSPADVMEPNEADHVTPVLLVVPWTFAVNWTLVLGAGDAREGEMVTEVTVGPEPFDPAATVTGAEADFVGSATLVAVTTPVPALDDAVYVPVDVMVPNEADHVTPVLLVAPWTVAVNWTLVLGAGDAREGEIVTDVTSAFDADPLPCNGSTTGRCFASVTIDKLPSTLAVVVATNFTAKLMLCDGERLRGGVKPARLKPFPVMLA
jgi:hypothetical protein